MLLTHANEKRRKEIEEAAIKRLEARGIYDPRLKCGTEAFKHVSVDDLFDYDGKLNDEIKLIKKGV